MEKVKIFGKKAKKSFSTRPLTFFFLTRSRKVFLAFPPRSASSRAAPSPRTALAGSRPHHGDLRHGARSVRRHALDGSRVCRRKALLFVVVVGRRVDFERRFRRREVDQLALRHGLW
jgi:hypothetical protein